MKFFQRIRHFFLVFAFLGPQICVAENLRSGLTTLGDNYMQGQVSPQDLIPQIKTVQQESSFSTEEKNYLEDLTKKLPPDLRSELCPSMSQGLCAEAPHFRIWEEVPKLPPEGLKQNWWSRNQGTLWTTLLVGGLAMWASSHVTKKELQIGPSGTR